MGERVVWSGGGPSKAEIDAAQERLRKQIEAQEKADREKNG